MFASRSEGSRYQQVDYVDRCAWSYRQYSGTANMPVHLCIVSMSSPQCDCTNIQEHLFNLRFVLAVLLTWT